MRADTFCWFCSFGPRSGGAGSFALNIDESGVRSVDAEAVGRLPLSSLAWVMVKIATRPGWYKVLGDTASMSAASHISHVVVPCLVDQLRPVMFTSPSRVSPHQRSPQRAGHTLAARNNSFPEGSGVLRTGRQRCCHDGHDHRSHQPTFGATLDFRVIDDEVGLFVPEVRGPGLYCHAAEGCGSALAIGIRRTTRFGSVLR